MARSGLQEAMDDAYRVLMGWVDDQYVHHFGLESILSQLETNANNDTNVLTDGTEAEIVEAAARLLKTRHQLKEYAIQMQNCLARLNGEDRSGLDQMTFLLLEVLSDKLATYERWQALANDIQTELINLVIQRVEESEKCVSGQTDQKGKFQKGLNQMMAKVGANYRIMNTGMVADRDTAAIKLDKLRNQIRREVARIESLLSVVVELEPLLDEMSAVIDMSSLKDRIKKLRQWQSWCWANAGAIDKELLKYPRPRAILFARHRQDASGRPVFEADLYRRALIHEQEMEWRDIEEVKWNLLRTVSYNRDRTIAALSEIGQLIARVETLMRSIQTPEEMFALNLQLGQPEEVPLLRLIRDLLPDFERVQAKVIDVYQEMLAINQLIGKEGSQFKGLTTPGSPDFDQALTELFEKVYPSSLKAISEVCQLGKFIQTIFDYLHQSLAETLSSPREIAEILQTIQDTSELISQDDTLRQFELELDEALEEAQAENNDR